MTSGILQRICLAAGVAFCTLVTCSAASADTMLPVKADVLNKNFTRLSTDTSAIASDAPLSLTIELKGNDDALYAYIPTLYDRNSPNYHKWLTPTQFGERFGASSEDVAQVAQWARENGLNVSSVWENHRFISVSTTMGVAEAALHVTLHSYVESPDASHSVLSSDVVYGSDTNPTLPASIASKVLYVSGLTDAMKPLTNYERFPNTVPFSPKPAATSATSNVVTPLTNPLGPPDLKKIYDFGGLDTAAASQPTQGIAVFEPAQFAMSDVTAFEKNYGITAPAPVEKWPASGRAPLDPDTEVEAELDIEVIMGQAPSSQMTLYEGENVIDSLNEIASDDLPVISMSYGYPENVGGNATFVAFLDPIIEQMASQGETLCNSSGDSGEYGGFRLDGDTQLSVSWPASDDFTLGVGGTNLPNTNNGFWNSETAWADYTNGVFQDSGSGGGLSSIFSLPFWQTGPGVSNSQSNGMRQVPDVAALGAFPYYNIYTEGSFQPVWGTSASCPLWASAILLMDEAMGGRQGLINPALYSIGQNATEYASGFHDITSGANPDYSATPGWDYLTGWGSADFSNLYTILTVNPNPPPTINPQPGLYSGPITVTITPPTAGWTIFYTLDGSDPAVSSTAIQYTGPFTLRQDATVTAVAEHSGDPNSTEAASSYSFQVIKSFGPGLQMISLPFQYDGSSLDDIFLNPPTLAIWQPTAGKYAVTPNTPANTIQPGQAYWVRVPQGSELDVYSVGQGLLDLTKTFSISLSQGWNMIADPLYINVTLSNCSVTTQSDQVYDYVQAITNNVLGLNLYSYDPVALDYDTITPFGSISPFEGYWIYAYQPCTLAIPPTVQ